MRKTIHKAIIPVAGMGTRFLTLKTQESGKDGEIRLADAFSSHLSAGKPIYGC